MYSGSWDYTVRIWSRSRLKCLSVIPCSDWVWGVCPRGKNLLVRLMLTITRQGGNVDGRSYLEFTALSSLCSTWCSVYILLCPAHVCYVRPLNEPAQIVQVAAGRQACTFDLETGRPLRRFDSGSERNVLHSPRVEGTRDGKLLFVGNAEGDLLAYDLRSSSQAAANTLWQHGALVQSIAFDDPWMAAAMDDGATLLLNADAAMRGGRSGPGPGGRAAPRGGCAAVRRQFPSAGAGPAYCVDIADQWLACGSGVRPACSKLLHACIHAAEGDPCRHPRTVNCGLLSRHSQLQCMESTFLKDSGWCRCEHGARLGL